MTVQITRNSKADQRPLVTFALFAYNQEKYIREAVEGALAQTYCPLQIILSDDCSSDLTANILEQLAERYVGPHEVIINKNEANLGVAAHVNRVMRLAAGELIVLAAGDDISLPERTGILVNHWLSFGKGPALCSGFTSISSSGEEMGDPHSWYREFQPYPNERREEILCRLIRTGVPALVGCTEAWRRDIFGLFGPLESGAWSEDKAMSVRAWLIGEIRYLPECLVKYRQHENNISNSLRRKNTCYEDVWDAEMRSAALLDMRLKLLAMAKKDARRACELEFVNAALHDDILSVASKEIVKLQCRARWLESPYRLRLLYFLRLFVVEPSIANLKWIMPRLLPFFFYARLRLLLQH